MTALRLLAYISGTLLLQLAVGIGIAVWHARRSSVLIGTPADRAAPRTNSGAWPGWREFRVARRVFEDARKTQCSFYLEPADGAPLTPFKPGQYLTFLLEVAETAEGLPGALRRITRCYSLSDGPQPGAFRVTIKRAMPPSGRPDLPPGLSSGHFHDRVREGDILTVKAPSGQFFLDPDSLLPAVLVAGGVGITPMMSMLSWCLIQRPLRTVYLYYGLRHGGEHAFKQVLEDLAATHPNFHLTVVYSGAGPEDVPGRDYQHSGHVDVELLRATLPHGRCQFYVCGPPPMMASLVPALGVWGVAAEDIHCEAFGPASVTATQVQALALGAVDALPLEIRFLRAGRTLAWDGQDANLLDFAERHGVEVESGCRSGSCGSCETRLASGTVRYGHKPDHDITPGCCLLCVGVPEGDLELQA